MLIGFFNQFSFGQEVNWVKKIGGKSIDNGSSLTFDSQDNLYYSGNFLDTVDFDLGPSQYNLIDKGVVYNYPDLFISKVDADCNFIWAKSIESTGTSRGGNHISHGEILISGKFIYIVGRFFGTFDFDPSANIASLTSTIYYKYDGFILKLDLDGNFQWVKQLKGDSNKSVVSIDDDQSGNLYVTGFFAASVDFDFGSGTNVLQAYDYDTYILKMKPDGTTVWAKQLKGRTTGNSSSKLKIDDLGNIYIFGQFTGLTDFDPGAGASNLNSNGEFDIYLLKLNPLGNFLWVRSYGGIDNDYAESFDINKDGDVYCISEFYDQTQVNLKSGTKILYSFGTSDVIVTKYNSIGDLLWANNFGGKDADIGADIKIDSYNKKLFITGHFNDTADFYYTSGGRRIVSKGDFDVYYLTLGYDGEFICVNATGGSWYDFSSNLALNSKRDLFSIGTFNNTIDFGFGNGSNSITSNGSSDAFLLKFKNCAQKSSIDKISACDSVKWIDGLTYYSDNNSAKISFNNINCCDSTVFLDLKIYKHETLKVDLTVCDSISFNSHSFSQSGKYFLKSSNIYGCDSIIELNLIVHPSKITDIKLTSCEPITWNNVQYTKSGDFIQFNNTSKGCDSTVILHLTIDSIVQNHQRIQSCDQYTWNNITYKQSGTYRDSSTSLQGCDSITTLDLIINNSSNSTTSIRSCDTYTWNGNTYTNSGTYTFKTQNAQGCDSTATLDLQIDKSSIALQSATSCDSLLWNGTVYTTSGIYTHKTQNTSGCDSTITLNLSIQKSDTTVLQQKACDGYNWNGKTYTQSGLYQDKMQNIHGCDSIIHLQLTINKSNTVDLQYSVCDSLNFLGKTLNTSGHYSFTIPNTQGCDSIINLSLNISSQHYKDSVSNCGSYVWPINGRSYDSSGVYVERYSNAAGCDSMYVLNLKVNKNYEIKEQAEVCKEYLWPVNKQVYTHSGLYRYPFKSSQGCDSILSLDLRINPEFKQIDTVITTSEYLWPVNKQIYPSSGSYEEDYTSSNGCDSIHLLLLTINKEVSIYYPNVINPGGINEWFTIFVYGGVDQIKELSIYDRWGSLVWQKESFPPNELQQGWNGLFKGQKALPGVYVWKAEIELQDGRIIMENGDVTVLR